MQRDAEQNLADGAVTAGYKADPREIIALLKRAQASEWTSFLQYWHHYFMASDIHSKEVQDVFKEHAEDELEHARRFGERIQQLGGVPCSSPEEIQRLTPTPVEYDHDLGSMMEADLVGERQTIDFYDEIIRTCGFDDNVTRRIFEDVVDEEAGHADDWATLLFAFDGTTGRQIESISDQLKQFAKSSGAERGQARRTA
jgi:bacterioferritin